MEWNTAKLEKRKTNTAILTLKFFEDNNIKYLGDFDEFINFLKEAKIKKLKKIEKNHKCSVCDNYGEIYGNALNDIIKFYTLDKPGYIASGFNRLET